MRRYAVEIYFSLTMLLLGIALVMILSAVEAERQAPTLTLWVVIAALVSFIAAMVASDVRERELYNSQAS